MESPNNGHVGDILLYSWQVNSVPRGLFVVEGLSASRSVRFGRLHCIHCLYILKKISDYIIVFYAIMPFVPLLAEVAQIEQ